MTLDNEQQRAFLLEIFKQAQFSGQVLDIAYTVKKAIESAVVATIATPEAKKE